MEIKDFTLKQDLWKELDEEHEESIRGGFTITYDAYYGTGSVVTKGNTVSINEPYFQSSFRVGRVH